MVKVISYQYHQVRNSSIYAKPYLDSKYAYVFSRPFALPISFKQITRIFKKALGFFTTQSNESAISPSTKSHIYIKSLMLYLFLRFSFFPHTVTGMKIVDKIKEAQTNQHIAYSFEYFPPKTELVNV
jgi:hypothetical protein